MLLNKLQTGLFSAAVAVLLAVTVLDLKPNPQDTTAFYLKNIYLLLADANISRSIPVTPVEPPTFSPPTYVVWVNSLLSLSLVIGLTLTCAMLATLVQQWGRRYLRITQGLQYTPHDRGRIRTFLTHGVKKLHFPRVVEAISTLINISLFLFFAGFLIYLFNTNHTVFTVVVWWIAASIVAYLVITFMPILRPDSPYYVPLSSLIFWILAGTSYQASLVLDRFAWLKVKTSTLSQSSVIKYLGRLSQGMETIIEERIQRLTPEIDGLILQWTFDAVSLAPDGDLDEFFKSIIGVYSSKRIVKDPKSSLATLGSPRFSSALVAFLSRTLSESGSDKIGRFITCMNVADATQSRVFWSLLDLFRTHQNVLLTVGVASRLKEWKRTDKEIDLCAKIMIAEIVAKVEGRDSVRVKLAADQLGKSEDDIKRYLDKGNYSLSLASWIYVTGEIFSSRSGLHRRLAIIAAREILPPSGFDIEAVHSDLRHDFNALRNKVVAEVQSSGTNSAPYFILQDIDRIETGFHRSPNDALQPSTGSL